ncbi:MAG: zinc ribbon domain-containing protein [Planctomycetota bacterium]|nr:zinc ribbon domain-containing protein [Planctomycetota bacterium]
MEDSIQDCPACGNSLNSKVRVCPHCGHHRGQRGDTSSELPPRSRADKTTSRYVGRSGIRGRKKMSMFAGRMYDAIRGLGVLVLIGAGIWFFYFFDKGPSEGSLEARQRFVDEIRQFDRFDENETLIMDTIDEVYRRVNLSHRDSRRAQTGLRGSRTIYGPFIWDRYRLTMYQKVMTALKEDAIFSRGDETVVDELEQFVARAP